MLTIFGLAKTTSVCCNYLIPLLVDPSASSRHPPFTLANVYLEPLRRILATLTRLSSAGEKTIFLYNREYYIDLLSQSVHLKLYMRLQ